MNADSPIYSTLSDLILSDQIYEDKADKLFKLISVMEENESLGSPGIYMMIRPRGFGLTLVTQAMISIIKKDNDISSNSLASLREQDFQHIVNSYREDTDPLQVEKKHVSKDENGEADREEEIEAIKSFYNIKQHHVLTFDFHDVTAKSSKEFTGELMQILQEQFWINHIESHISPYQTPKAYFEKLLNALHEKNADDEIVIIIDNYDIPFIVASEFDEEQREESISDYLDMLNVLKYANKIVKWVLLTGHINFSLASETSEGLPLVTDLSNESMFAALFGFTREDIVKLYSKQIKQFSENLHLTEEKYLDALERCYGGFLFADNDELFNPEVPKIFCPACIAHCMANGGVLFPYSASGNYSFLRKQLEKNSKDLNWLYGKDGQDPLFSYSVDVDVKGKQLGTLLIQLGFATRKAVFVNQTDNYVTWRYRFDFPNLDMKKTFEYLTTGGTPTDLTEAYNFESHEPETIYI